jgi:hypothetical protein
MSRRKEEKTMAEKTYRVVHHWQPLDGTGDVMVRVVPADVDVIELRLTPQNTIKEAYRTFAQEPANDLPYEAIALGKSLLQLNLAGWHVAQRQDAR